MEAGWKIEKKFVAQLAQQIDIPHQWGRAAVTVFTANAKLGIGFDKCPTYYCFEKSVNDLIYENGETSISEGLDTANKTMFTKQHGMRPTSAKYLVLITDGKDDSVDYKYYKKLFQKRNINRIAIGVGNGVDADKLKQLVGDPRYYFPAADFSTLLNQEFISSIGICSGKFLLT